MSTSPAQLALLISAVSGAIGVAARSLLLLAAGLTWMYAKTPARQKAAAELARLLMTVPWQRAKASKTTASTGREGALPARAKPNTARPTHSTKSNASGG